MLTEAEVKRLPKGTFPNHVLRRAFGKKHGLVITGRFADKEGKLSDKEFVGNRSQFKAHQKNPLRPLPKTKAEKYSTPKVEKPTTWTRFIEFWKNLFGLL